MNPINCFHFLMITTSASGYNIRASQRILMDSEDDGVDNAETLMSFEYKEPATQDIPEPLNGTSWTSTEIALGSDIVKPITLSFGSSFIHGTTGCNRYRVEYEDLTDNSFLIVGDTMSITRMYCELTMEQELNYIDFLVNGTFAYETVRTSDESGAEVVQLVLSANEVGSGEEIVARFSKVDSNA